MINTEMNINILCNQIEDYFLKLVISLHEALDKLI